MAKYKREEKTKKGKNDYVDKERFYQALVEYKQQRIDAEEKGLPEPRPSDEIGLYIMKIVDRVIKSGRFNGYTDTWKDEMRAESIYSAVKSIKNFDVDKGKNPFAYFTTSTFYTCYNVIAKLKKNQQVSIDYNTETHNDYTNIGADGFYYDVPEIIHDNLVNRGIGYDAGYSDIDEEDRGILVNDVGQEIKHKEELDEDGNPIKKRPRKIKKKKP